MCFSPPDPFVVPPSLSKDPVFRWTYSLLFQPPFFLLTPEFGFFFSFSPDSVCYTLPPSPGTVSDPVGGPSQFFCFFLLFPMFSAPPDFAGTFLLKFIVAKGEFFLFLLQFFSVAFPDPPRVGYRFGHPSSPVARPWPPNFFCASHPPN